MRNASLMGEAECMRDALKRIAHEAERPKQDA
jgi:hypothetical protein